MSRSGYSDDCEGWDLIRWRGAVNAAIKGKRGQAFLREMRDALDAMPDKRLVSSVLVGPGGDCCAMGCVAIARGLDVSGVDPYETEDVGKALGIARSLAAEIAHENDEGLWRADATPESRWKHVRAWVEQQIKKEPVSAG